MKFAQQKIKDCLLNAIAASLEGIAFMEAEECDHDNAFDNSYINAKLSILSPIKCDIYMVAPILMAREISETLYGVIEENKETPVIIDVFGELLNTVAGKMMCDLISDDTTLQLGLPDVNIGAPALPETDNSTYSYMCDSHVLQVILHGDIIL